MSTTRNAREPKATEQVVVLGGGPAGLTAAYELTRHGVPAAVLEQDGRYVGGIARTVEHNGYRFDIGGHRFFSKNQEIEDLWTEILGDEMLTRDRLSRIYYRGRYFAYPLKATNALVNLGALETLLCMASYARARIDPVRDPRCLEDWVRNQFGHRLYSMFFKTYTEKVWGMSTRELSADWAAQRIKGLDMVQVIKGALLPQRRPKDRGAVIKTLIDEFRYPRLGPGQLWERVRDVLAERGQPVMMGYRVRSLRRRGRRVISAVVDDPAGNRVEVPGHQFISSLPIRELVLGLEPSAPEPVRRAAKALGYRDFLTVALMIRRGQVFPDNWIYIHEPTVKVGRIQNFKNWSPAMVPDPSTTCLGLEYFCFEGDGLWSARDTELVQLAGRELAQLGICSTQEIFDGVVVRQQKAYPVYDDNYLANVAIVREYLEAALPNLHLVGRNGMHKYNNQDHSMLTALITARNIALGTTLDPWKVNADAEYHEEVTAGEDTSGRRVPARLAS
jgi:protoporphyrinogen oxidase